MKNRRPPSNKIRSLLQKEISSRCPFCHNEDVDHFEVHHIDQNPSNNNIENLLLLCPLCHSKITKGDISLKKVYSVKKDLMNAKHAEQKQSSYMKITFTKSVKNAIVGHGNVINIKNASKKSKNTSYSEGSIGKAINHKNYISYLITRYHEYKEREVGRENMNFAIFPSTLKKRYMIGKGNTIYNIPLEAFDDLVGFIEKRINGTMFARQLGKGHPHFKSFREYEIEIQKRFESTENE